MAPNGLCYMSSGKGKEGCGSSEETVLALLEMATSQPCSACTQANITNPPLHAVMSQLQDSQHLLQPTSSTHWELKGELKLIALICC